MIRTLKDQSGDWRQAVGRRGLLTRRAAVINDRRSRRDDGRA
jgi:hypothetical protein